MTAMCTNAQSLHTIPCNILIGYLCFYSSTCFVHLAYTHPVHEIDADAVETHCCRNFGASLNGTQQENNYNICFISLLTFHIHVSYCS